MAAALADDVVMASPDLQGCDEVARLPNGQPNGAVTHEQIIGALGRVEGLIEAESEARRDFRDSFLRRLESVENKTGEIGLEIQRLGHRMETSREAPGIAHAIVRLLEHQPFLGLIFAVVVVALGSGGVISIWEAVTK